MNRSQLAIIHIAKKQLGMDEPTYRQMLKNCAGVRSSKALDEDGYAAVLSHLESCGFKSLTKHSKLKTQNYYQAWSKYGNRPGMATVAMLALIEHLWDQCSWYWNSGGFGDRQKAQRGFLKGRFSVDDLKFLKFTTAFAVIAALKSVATRGQGTADNNKQPQNTQK